MNESAAATAAPQELSLPDALRLAIDMQQDRLYEGAQTIYQRILAVAPGQPDALHYLGLLHFQRGSGERGLALILQAIEADPGYSAAWNNLGNIHASRNAFEAAALAYRQALALCEARGDAEREAIADLHNNLGALHQVQGRHAEARAAFEQAVALVPRHIRAHNNLGLLAAEEGDRERAIRHYIHALELMPAHGDSRKMLGLAYYASGKIAEAAETFRQWLEIEPGNPVARHLHAACSGTHTPERAPDDYVEHTFDRFATSFEQQLNERLAYQAPQLCEGLLRRLLPRPARTLAMLDAGCGTGLCGPLMAPWAQSLAGVDLSRGMLDLARTKGVYDELHKAELGEFLRRSPRGWDVIVSADTLCYFGDLAAVITAAAGALRPGGMLVFTVEALPEAGAEQGATPWRLEPHGRYAHAQGHVRAVLARAGLHPECVEPVVLRQEGGKPVAGWLVAALAAPSSDASAH